MSILGTFDLLQKCQWLLHVKAMHFISERSECKTVLYDQEVCRRESPPPQIHPSYLTGSTARFTHRAPNLQVYCYCSRLCLNSVFTNIRQGNLTLFIFKLILVSVFVTHQKMTLQFDYQNAVFSLLLCVYLYV